MEKQDDRLVQSAQRLLSDLIDCSSSEIGDVKRYGSPIEVLLARAFNVMSRLRYPGVIIDDRDGLDLELVDEQLVDGGPNPIFVMIAPQFKIGQYRVDFAVRYIFGLEGAAGLIVECDGHEFHEKTKEQAARDKARDRFLASAGYRVMRFAGSEIWADPIACAEQALEATYHKAMDSCRARAYRNCGDLANMERELRYLVRGDAI